MSNKHTMELSSELVGYISQMIEYEKIRIQRTELEELIKPILDEWCKAEEKYCGYNTAEYLKNVGGNNVN